MKKIMMMGLLMVATCCLRAEDTEFKVALDQAIATGSQENVLALLGQIPKNNFDVYKAATMLLPKPLRLEYLETLPEFDGKPGLIVRTMPNGADRNARLVSLFSTRQVSVNCAALFDEQFATKEECIAFYELVLKNITANKRTVDDLGKVKGQLLKLKD